MSSFLTPSLAKASQSVSLVKGPVADAIPPLVNLTAQAENRAMSPSVPIRPFLSQTQHFKKGLDPTRHNSPALHLRSRSPRRRRGSRRRTVGAQGSCFLSCCTGPLWGEIKTKIAACRGLNTTKCLNNPIGPHNCVATAVKCKVRRIGSNERFSLNNNLF